LAEGNLTVDDISYLSTELQKHGVNLIEFWTKASQQPEELAPAQAIIHYTQNDQESGWWKFRTRCLASVCGYAIG
jgi:hypothetical protein